MISSSNSSKNELTHNKKKSLNRTLTSVMIFLFVLISEGIPYKNYGFDLDDCGILSHVKKNQQSFLSFFFDKDIVSLTFPSNYSSSPDEKNFFAGFYRPLSKWVFAIQVALFDSNSYYYFFVSIFFHALNSAIIFHIFFYLFNSFLWALLGSLFFACHISLSSWLGWIGAQIYPINLFVLLLSFFFFWHHLKKNTILSYIFSILLYMFSIFYFELSIVYPAFIFLLFFILRELKINIAMSLTDYLKRFLGFALVSIFFLFLRFLNYPSFASYIHPTSNKTSLIQALTDRIPHLFTFLSEMANIPFIPSGNFSLKALIITTLLSLYLYLVIRCRQQYLIFFFLCCGSLFLWPSVRYYTSRYAYHFIPFFISAIIYIIKQTVNIKAQRTYVTALGLTIIILVNFTTLQKSLKTRENQTKNITNAYKELIKNPLLKDKNLCFIGIPFMPFRSSLAQSLWFLGFNDSKQIYGDISSFFECPDEQYRIEPFKITQIKNGFRLQSSDDNLCWPNRDYQTAMGEKIVHKFDRQGRISDVTFIFDEKYLNKDTVFITWDCKSWKFKILGPFST